MTEADKKKLDRITEQILKQIDEKGFQQTGAFNLRHNGIALCHGDSEHIKIRKKEDKPGIDVYIDGDTKGEQVHIPVVVDASGMTDIVYKRLLYRGRCRRQHSRLRDPQQRLQ